MRIIASILIIFILVITTPVFLLVSSVRANVLTSTFLKHELARHDLYGVAFGLIDDKISEIEIPPDFPVTHEEISTLVKQVFTPAWLQRNVEGVLDGFDAWLNAPSGVRASVLVSLAEPKAALGKSIDALLEQKLTELAPCPDKRQAKEEQGICQFAGLGLADVKEQLQHNGMDPDMVTKLLPDTLDILNPDLSKIVGETDKDNPQGSAAKSAKIGESLERFKSQYQLGVRVFWYAWVIYAALLAEFIVINSTRGWRRLVRWVGAMFVSIGLLPAAMAIASVLVVQNVVLPKIHLDPKFPAEVASLVPQVIGDVRAAVFTLPLAVGAALVVLGLAGIIGGHWIPKVANGKEKK